MQLPAEIWIVIALVVIITCVILYRFFLKKTREKFFLTIEDGRQNMLILDPLIPQADFERLTSRASKADHESLKHSFEEVTSLLLDPLPELAKAPDIHQYFEKLNSSQRVLSILAQFDNKTGDGGIRTFVNERPEAMYATLSALELIGSGDMAASFKALLSELEAHLALHARDQARINRTDTNSGHSTTYEMATPNVPDHLDDMDEYLNDNSHKSAFYEQVLEFVTKHKHTFGVKDTD